MQTIVVGTAPIQLLHPNINRIRWTVQYTPSSIASGNTGRIFIGRGFIPNATVGDSNQGDVLNAGAGIEEKKAYQTDTLPWKGNIWIVSDTASQQVTFDEQSEVPAPPTT